MKMYSKENIGDPGSPSRFCQSRPFHQNIRMSPDGIGYKTFLRSPNTSNSTELEVFCQQRKYTEIGKNIPSFGRQRLNRPPNIEIPRNSLSSNSPTLATTPSKSPRTPEKSSNIAIMQPHSPEDVPKSPAFAGAKFGSSPTPKSLPHPPPHWISSKCHPQPCHEMARQIKMLLQMV